MAIDSWRYQPSRASSVASGVSSMVAQGLEAVAGAVLLALQRRVAQLGPRLDVQHEQQAVEVAEALAGQLAREILAEHLFMADLAQVPDCLVSEQLHRFAHAEFQILGHREGVLVRVLVERVEERDAIRRAEAVGMQQRRHRPERRRVAPREDLREIEPEQSLLAPLRAIDQSHLVGAVHEHPPRRLIGAKHQPRDHLIE